VDPRDDETTYVYNTLWSYDRPIRSAKRSSGTTNANAAAAKNICSPATSSRRTKNDYFIDREVQRTRTYTGIPGINTQDYALQEGMDRSAIIREHLGTSDAAIIAARSYSSAIDAVARGERPRGSTGGVSRGAAVR